MIFIVDLIACSTCFGHHYAHHQELESIIQVVAAYRIWCFGFQVVGMVWSWGLCVRFAGCSSSSSSSPQTGHITLSQNHTKATDNLCNEKRQSYRGKYKTAPDCKAVPVPNYALAAASGAVPPRITPALDHCQRSASCPKKRFLRHATNRKLVGGDTASYPWRGSSHHKCSVIRSFAKHNTDWLFRFNNSHSWHSQDRASLYILIINANETHYFSDLFDRVLYMIRTGPLSIIWSISTLYTRNRYLWC